MIRKPCYTYAPWRNMASRQAKTVSDSSPSTSSAGGQSPQDTPATQLTEPSPDTCQTHAKALSNRILQPPSFALQGSQTCNTLTASPRGPCVVGFQDPFTSPSFSPQGSVINDRPRLSATAPIFTPGSDPEPFQQSQGQGVQHACKSCFKSRKLQVG